MGRWGLGRLAGLAPVVLLFALSLVAIANAGRAASAELPLIGAIESVEGKSPAAAPAKDASGKDASGKDVPAAPSEAAALQSVIDAAKSSGATIMVITPGAGTNTATAAQSQIAQQPVGKTRNFVRTLLHLKIAIVELADDIPMHIATFADSLAQEEASGNIDRVIWGARNAAISAVFGVLALLLYRRWSVRELVRLAQKPVRDRADRVGFLLARGFLMVVGVAVFVIVSGAVVTALSHEVEETRKTFLVFLVPVTEILVGFTVIVAIVAPREPAHRVVRLRDRDARWLAGQLLAVVIFAAIASGCVAYGEIMDVARSVQRLFKIAGLVVPCIWLSLIATRLHARMLHARLGGMTHAHEHGAHQHGAPVMPSAPAASAGEGPAAHADPAIHASAAQHAHTGFDPLLGHAMTPLPPSAAELARNLRSASRFPARGLIVRHWALLTTIALLIAATLGTIRVLLNHTNPITPIIGPVGAVFGGMFVYAAMILFVDRVVAPIPTTLDDIAASQVSVRRREIARGVAEHVALVFAIAAAVVGVLAVWGIDVFDPRGPIGRSAGLFIAVLLATTAYRAVKLWLDQEIALERWAATEEEGQGATAAAIGSTTRLGTLLGIVRGFLLASIFIVALMIALDELGVNIAPLFAGAGLIGIAVSFGSQSLIKDMFSGMFYLIDDAFRTGEYIDIGLVKGTVEKISIRSFQLRHQNGPLNTVPFGEIKKLTNYSRDWVIVKLPIRVTYDTSVSHLNKVVKRISAELMEDEDVGPLFLQPLKSQGVYDMEDSAMVIRVKFMTRPNDQFLVRRAVYAKIRETFHGEGIKFAHRNVTVFVGSLDGQPVTPAQKAAAGAAVAPILADEAALQAVEDEDEGLPQP